MARRKRQSEEDLEFLVQNSSSPDPLSLSGPLPTSSPARTPRKTPHRASSRGRSPAKTTTLDIPVGHWASGKSPSRTRLLETPGPLPDTISPWKLKVTMQAVSNVDSPDNSPARRTNSRKKSEIAPQTQTFTIPLNDAEEMEEESQTPRRKSRARKSIGGSGKAKVQRQPTPARPRASTGKRVASPESEEEVFQSTPKRQRAGRSPAKGRSPARGKSPKISEMETMLEDEDPVTYPDPLKSTGTLGSFSTGAALSNTLASSNTRNKVTSATLQDIANRSASRYQKDQDAEYIVSSQVSGPLGRNQNRRETIRPYEVMSSSSPSSFIRPRSQSPQKSPAKEASTPLVKKFASLRRTPRSKSNSGRIGSKSPRVETEEEAAELELDTRSVRESSIDIMDVDVSDDGEPIGDETMAKSMDMTMVDPSTLETWNQEAEPMQSIIQEDASVFPNSPHVHFSSPLETPTPEHIRVKLREQQHEDQGSQSSPAQRKMERLRSPFKNQPEVAEWDSGENMSGAIPTTETPQSAKHLPTPDSDDKDDQIVSSRLQGQRRPALSRRSKSPASVNPAESLEDRWALDRQKTIQEAQLASPEQRIKIEDEDGDMSGLADIDNGLDVDVHYPQVPVEEEYEDEDEQEEEEHEDYDEHVFLPGDEEDEYDEGVEDDQLVEVDPTSEPDIWAAVAGSTPQSAFIPVRRTNQLPRSSSVTFRESFQKSVEPNSSSPHSNHSLDQIPELSRIDEIDEEEQEMDDDRDDRSVISALFRSSRFRRRPNANNTQTISDNTQRLLPQEPAQPVEPSSERDDSSMLGREDIGSLLRRKVNGILGNVDYSMMTGVGENSELQEELLRGMQPDEEAMQSSQPAIRLDIPSQGYQRSTSGQGQGQRLQIPTAHSPKKSSPLKRRLDIEEVETEEESDTNSPVAIASSEPARKRTKSPPKPVPTSSKTPKKPGKPSLLKLTQERRARATFFGSGVGSQVAQAQMTFVAGTRVSPRTTSATLRAPGSHVQTQPGLLGKMMNYISAWQPAQDETAPESSQIQNPTVGLVSASNPAPTQRLSSLRHSSSPASSPPQAVRSTISPYHSVSTQSSPIAEQSEMATQTSPIEEKPSMPEIPVTPQAPDAHLRPNHPLLVNFRLLPKAHPWTDTHFRSLLSLYRHWLTHESSYSPSLPQNARLLTPTWLQYIDMELSNWGYEFHLTPSLVVLAAVFKQLCVLEGGVQEYERLYGEGLDLGAVGRRTVNAGDITQWHIVLRLFTTIVGDLVREDEKRGRKVERKRELRWKWKGGWVWRRGWAGGLL